METKNLSVEEKMEEIRLVNRAKWILIEQLKMNEPDAHRHIEKQAMDRCVSKKEIAVKALIGALIGVIIGMMISPRKNQWFGCYNGNSVPGEQTDEEDEGEE